MKLEARGKYPGIKVHLEEDECRQLLSIQAIDRDRQLDNLGGGLVIQMSTKFVGKLGRKLSKLLLEEPALLNEKSLDDVTTQMEKDQRKILKQLAAIKNGNDWKAVE